MTDLPSDNLRPPQQESVRSVPFSLRGMSWTWLCLILAVESGGVEAREINPVDALIPVNVAPTATISITTALPIGAAPVDYYSELYDDVITRLQQQVSDGTVVLKSRPKTGYLMDLLRQLDVPIESQTLVFSKTSIHQSLIGPKRPRAIYFNDEITVGWTPGAPAIEITAQDSRKGTVYWTVIQPKSVSADEIDLDEYSVARRVSFRRDSRCTACHISVRTLNVPGHIVGSLLTDERGQPVEGFSSVSHATDVEKRFGGWYVTGTAPLLTHSGNLIGSADIERHKQEPSHRGTLKELSELVDLSAYPTAHSDVVALLVLTHQMQFLNLVNRVRLESVFNRHSDAEERLVRYALMQDEAPLLGGISGSAGFAEKFLTQIPVDSPCRSLRELDLKTRLFRHDVSPFVASRSFGSLPETVRHRLLIRMMAEVRQRENHTEPLRAFSDLLARDPDQVK